MTAIGTHHVTVLAEASYVSLSGWTRTQGLSHKSHAVFLVSYGR